MAEVDVETAIQAAIDRETIDSRLAAEAIATYYNTLTKNTNMTQELAQHLTAYYQQYYLSAEIANSNDDDDD